MAGKIAEKSTAYVGIKRGTERSHNHFKVVELFEGKTETDVWRARAGSRIALSLEDVEIQYRKHDADSGITGERSKDA